ncbi:MAG TPA: hypothetical protein VK625_14195, partial [Flavitalea sp.]|nr:hypothetical protein [Flavitalea sp.]
GRVKIVLEGYCVGAGLLSIDPFSVEILLLIRLQYLVRIIMRRGKTVDTFRLLFESEMRKCR